MNTVRLNNDVGIPQLGYGVYQIPEDEVERAVTEAIKVGYRAIDTAKYYFNEEGVGRAIKNSDVPREDLFITTKVWNSDHGYENTLKAFDESLKKLQVDYVDMYLIHWPMPDDDKYIETYRALEKLYKDGRVRAIGVCNFDIDHLERLLAECDVKPVVNQVECHPYLQQKDMKAFCKEHGILQESWSPLYKAGDVVDEAILKDIAKKHNVTPVQAIIRWHLQSGSIVIPKTVTPHRMRENFDVFGFELTDTDMEEISSLDKGLRCGPEPKTMHKQ